MGRRKNIIRDTSDKQRVAGAQLLDVYDSLAQRGEHLITGILQNKKPLQWEHYPDDDAIDARSGYQWFYHSHTPEDRSGVAEHGHIHLFAYKKTWEGRLRSKREQQFTQLQGTCKKRVKTRHLLTIGFDGRGIPITLFTVNSWVTGDLLLNKSTTVTLLKNIKLETGYPEIDTVITSLATLFMPEIRELLLRRDAKLWSYIGDNVFEDEALEVLSECSIDIDIKLLELAEKG